MMRTELSILLCRTAIKTKTPINKSKEKKRKKYLRRYTYNF